ncbi:MAG: glutamine--fructose-6-phosphate transaminase (isomerizing) [Flavobacteriales bacterium]|nr:glutamine--fructose-6-phosphate transaminase (isomerizing) [Flavobacteriales bacterium]|tara:strand:+ start:853 stop:2694 length:1842 start_codon:yes stop_codon:yes gene_type:complete
MCGIVGYIGNKDAVSILLKGLQRLEYRGYDSAGIACIKENAIQVFKTKGKVSDLKKIITEDSASSSIGIGHTRWATHGPPNQVNAHPHFSGDGSLALIHNGIIENYSAIKSALESKGHEFVSQTDTEVLVHLIEDIISNEKISLFEAVRVALDEVIGAYAIIVMQKGKPEEFVAARKGSPLVIGIGRNEYYVASDATPIVEHTNNVIYLEDGHIARINKNENIEIKNIKNKNITPYVQELKLNIDAIEKGGFSHFMLKEIYEQPSSIRDTMRGRIDPITKEVKLGGILEYQQKIVNANRIIIVACGTSWHAGLIGEYIIEDFARIPVEVEYASEFRYRNPIISSKDIVLAISQSGETADTLAAISLAKEKGATILGICNVVGSSIARLTHAGIYTHAGPEIGVASTKAFTTQVIVLILMALKISQNNGNLTLSDYHQLIRELELIPSKVKEVLKINEQIKKIAFEFKDATNFLYLGRGYNFPVALEGALKLKEISYIHAEGYPAAEMKHGPIALIDDKMPIVVIATKKGNYEKVISNIQEVKARGGKIIAIINQGDEVVNDLVDYSIEIPNSPDELSPLLTNIPLQLLSYHIAVIRGCNVDQPRNLAKSVTVE